MKKMNVLKIFALVLLSLSKFETMFGMKGNNIEDNINDEYVNKNYYLIDELWNKITLDNGEDIKFKIYLRKDINKIKGNENEDILKISEEESNKILTTFAIDENKEIYSSPIAYINEEVIIWHEENNDDKLYTAFFPVDKKDREEYEKNAIPCRIIKKIGEDSINDDYILVDAENKKIEKIKEKNIVFKLLTRKKYLELKETLNDPGKFLKDEGKYILDDLQGPLLFEVENNDLILYVKRLKDFLHLAWVPALETPINFNKENSIKVHMVKKKEIYKVEEKEKDNNSSECCCGIC